MTNEFGIGIVIDLNHKAVSIDLTKLYQEIKGEYFNSP
jgi:hypothetical protein